MTTFKEIRGTAVESVSSDPTNPEVGQIWYNNTIGVLKGNLLVAAAWASGGNLGTTRQLLAGAGTQTAGLGFGGNSGGYLANTEKYDGTSWTSTGNLNTARAILGGAGLQTAALAFSGEFTPGYSNSTESFNGSTWTSVNPINTARSYISGCGTQTAALAFGGSTGALSSATELWDGTGWTSVPSLSTARAALAGAGIQTVGLAFGGYSGTPDVTNVTEEWSGPQTTVTASTLTTS